MKKKTRAAAAHEPEASAILAVVIPAWRGEHLRAALNSLKEQHDGRFRVYVGDDASPDDLASLVAEFRTDLDLVYHRFDENMGGRDLVSHWQRCIALTRDEPWIWLFSDDDEAEPECAESFHQELASGGGMAVDLFRFDLKIIDREGKLVRAPEENPVMESSGELLRCIFHGGRREWRAPEHIFSRSVYEREGGFVNLPLALYSDLATWVVYAKRGGVKTLQPGKVRWRSHGEGVSSGNRIKNRDELLVALEGFMRWATEHLQAETNREVRAAGARFLCRELGRVQPPVPWNLWRHFTRCAKALAPEYQLIDVRVVMAILLSRVRHYPLFSSLLYWRYLWRMKR